MLTHHLPYNYLSKEIKMNKELKDFVPISGIYVIINKITGKSYVGQSKNIMFRWAQHVEDLVNSRHSNLDLQKDWIKYGANSFVARLVKRCEPELLLKEESYCIREYRGMAGVYNKGQNMPSDE